MCKGYNFNTLLNIMTALINFVNYRKFYFATDEIYISSLLS